MPAAYAMRMQCCFMLQSNLTICCVYGMHMTDQFTVRPCKALKGSCLQVLAALAYAVANDDEASEVSCQAQAEIYRHWQTSVLEITKNALLKGGVQFGVH